MDKAQLAENIRTGRARLNLTRVQFAKKARITTNTLRTLESGNHARLPDTETLRKVAKALRTTTEALLSGKMPIEADDPLLSGLNQEDLRVARLYHDATTVMRQRIAGLLQDDEPERVSAIARRCLLLTQNDLIAVDEVITGLERAREPAAAKGHAHS